MYQHLNVYITATIHQIYSSMKQFKYFWQLIKSLNNEFWNDHACEELLIFCVRADSTFQCSTLFIFKNFPRVLPLYGYKDLRESTFDTVVENNRQTTKAHRAESIPTHDQIDFVCDDRPEPSVNVLRYHFSKGNIPSIVLSLKSLERTTKS